MGLNTQGVYEEIINYGHGAWQREKQSVLNEFFIFKNFPELYIVTRKSLSFKERFKSLRILFYYLGKMLQMYKVGTYSDAQVKCFKVQMLLMLIVKRKPFFWNFMFKWREYFIKIKINSYWQCLKVKTMKQKWLLDVHLNKIFLKLVKQCFCHF